MAKKAAPDESTVYEVHYTDLAGHDRYANLFNEDEALAEAQNFANQGLLNVQVRKVVSSVTPLDQTFEPEPEFSGQPELLPGQGQVVEAEPLVVAAHPQPVGVTVTNDDPPKK
ncbi:MAG: hypothetical protein JO214_00680 [Frankiaceae bacterium]|nr:hypothetical protein [Frankiaceae bacterium]